jgi:hypothetical protein
MPVVLGVMPVVLGVTPVVVAVMPVGQCCAFSIVSFAGETEVGMLKNSS